ncbi:MAG: FkbM family methyltransferase [Dongiaceae bacterium]
MAYPLENQMAAAYESLIISRPLAAFTPYEFTYVPWPFSYLKKLGGVKKERRRKWLVRRWTMMIHRYGRPFLKNSRGRLTLYSSRAASFRALNLNYAFHYLPGYAGKNEIETLCLLRCLTAGGNFYDIGANWGYFSHAIAADPAFTGQVHSFEANPEVYGDLNGLIKDLGLEKKITAYNFALSNQAAALAMDAAHNWDSGQAKISAKGKLAITAKTLDSLNLAPPQAIKIDVEGHELQVLRGAQETLQKHKPFIVMENWNLGRPAGEILEPLYFLENLNYQFYLIGWLAGEEENYVSSSIDNAPNQAQARIALLPFLPKARLLHEKSFRNILAAPRNKTAQLQELLLRP